MDGQSWTHSNTKPFWARPVLGRRMFFRHLASAVGGYFLVPGRPGEMVAKAAVTPMGTAKNVIFILLQGAPSHTDTFDLKEGSWTPRTFNPTSYGDIRFPQGLMPSLAEMINDFALVRSLRAKAVVHSLMQTWLQIGRNPTSALAKISPHIGSVVSIERGGTASKLPAFVSLNGTPAAGSGYMPAVHAPFLITAGNALPNTQHSAGIPRFTTRTALLENIDAQMRITQEIGDGVAEMTAWNERARGLMYNPDVDRVFQLSNDERTRFGNNGFGNACLVARNLLRSNLGTRFVQINFGSWDHHTNIYAANAQLTPMARQFDTGLSNLINDLKAANLFDETLIFAMGEFGRTVGPPNSSAGRDHHPQQAALFAGGGVRGGRAIGVTDAAGGNIVQSGWSRQREINNEDLEATIYSALGIDWTTTRRDDPLGRGFEYVPFADRDQYGPVNELFG
ncbi:MAG: DUF1501 domain-containing protein [Bryobacteraceae bacterium]